MDDTVTHFVHQGKKEKTKDFIKASEMKNVHMVSPQWIEECRLKGMRVPEALFPCSIDTRMGAIGLNVEPPTNCIPGIK